MRCFNHREAEAVAICKNCARALCPDCAVEFDDGISCRGRCEEAVQAISSLISKNTSLAPAAGRPWTHIALVHVALGLIFIYAGLFEISRGPINFATLAGIVMLGAAVAYYLWARRVQRT
jgi:hypothetical protein